MQTYQALVDTVNISNKKNRLIHFDDSLTLIGTGRSAYVFKMKATDIVIKVFFPNFMYIAKEESEIYEILKDISYFPIIYESGSNYIVMEYIEGQTLFECITNGIVITEAHINEIDYALFLASDKQLNPSDIHLRNILITPKGEIKLIDVARFRQKKDCTQWSDLKSAFRIFYLKRSFPKKIPAKLLNIIAFLYKKRLIPTF
ncbi:hypothetical protein [Paenisporosarcina sp. TG20]|uniref:hypothetical protein n=1 Tax=Paenisporosarcina sp. TG20 TaxID=1211706 RepID=UPI0002F5F4C0|nr:hypothetical protein [Paenisporosarcina sp. TG20]